MTQLQSKSIIVKDLVLVGGGHAHIQVLRRLAMRPMRGVRVTVICREADAPYSGMLPGLIAGHYRHDQTHIDLRPLARFAGAQFFHDDVIGIDPANKLVLCTHRPPVPYDVLSLNTGSTPTTANIPGAREHVIPAKPIDRFLVAFELLRETVAARAAPSRIGVVGAGAGGVELILALQHRLQNPGSADHEYFLITDSQDILPTHNAAVRRRMNHELAIKHIAVKAEHKVTSITATGERKQLAFDGRPSLELDHIVWVTTAAAPAWLQASGLPVDQDGFLVVDSHLRSTGDPDIFAAGDIASVTEHPRPKSGVFAVRQGPPLTKNLKRRLTGRATRPFKPQTLFLSLITTGDRRAVASWRNLSAGGALIWRWKDHIDQTFMARFNDLPDMPDDDRLALEPGLISPQVLARLEDQSMRCGGCAAKVGPEILSRTLSGLDGSVAGSLKPGGGNRDDAAVVTPSPGKVMVHSVDGFRSFIDDPYVFGQIATNHALNDIYAMGADPVTALAIATMPFGLDHKIEADLKQMMAGVELTLAAHGTALIGGHTNEGQELALSLAVNGEADEASLLRKSNMSPGQALILTKPLGTGVLLAADMRHKAHGTDIDSAIATMLLSNRRAAEILAAHGATACTDVSGFGLAGHLIEMVDASLTAAAIDLKQLPALPGATKAFASGLKSSLHDQNEQLSNRVANADSHRNNSAFALLFDPQTAGGLLASVPIENAKDCVAALHAAGYDAATMIGKTAPRAPGDAAKPISLCYETV